MVVVVDWCTAEQKCWAEDRQLEQKEAGNVFWRETKTHASSDPVPVPGDVNSFWKDIFYFGDVPLFRISTFHHSKRFDWVLTIIIFKRDTSRCPEGYP